MLASLSPYDHFLKSNLSGQVIVVILLALSIGSWTLMLIKWQQLLRWNRDNQQFLEQPSASTSPSSFALLAQAHRRDPQHSEIVYERLCDRYEAHMHLLASITAVAPLLGLLGTVWGLMDAFGAVALEQNASIQTLAPGVSGALLTTVVGLCVAIPSTLGYNLLTGKIKHMEANLQDFATRLPG
jgi:biopolymer transport protein TolQ